MNRIIVAVLALGAAEAISADSWKKLFLDPDDGWLDGSQWLLDAKGFLPVPLIITEPALGVGFGVAGIFFHESKETLARVERGELAVDDKPQPSISGLVGAYTSNDSWLAGAFHLGIWKQDRYRYTGAAGYADLNLRFYGLDGGEAFEDGLRFDISASFLFQELKARIGDSDFFVGANYSFAGTETKFRVDPDIDDLIPALDSNNAGFGILVYYDSLDNSFTPNRGIEAELGYTRYDEALGGDFNYDYVEAQGTFYYAPTSRLVLGLHLEAEFANGEVPFYALPYINLRGIPAMRYQDNDVASAEVEARWNFHPRFALVGFVGAGRTAGEASDLLEGPTRKTRGVGLRYLLARRLNLYGGFDVARGPEEDVFYLQVGSAW